MYGSPSTVIPRLTINPQAITPYHVCDPPSLCKSRTPTPHGLLLGGPGGFPQCLWHSGHPGPLGGGHTAPAACTCTGTCTCSRPEGGPESLLSLPSPKEPIPVLLRKLPGSGELKVCCKFPFSQGAMRPGCLHPCWSKSFQVEEDCPLSLLSPGRTLRILKFLFTNDKQVTQSHLTLKKAGKFNPPVWQRKREL